MKTIFINPDNLTKKDIDEKIIRAKALIINSKNEIMLGFAHGTYQFPGGHLNKTESVLDCLQREVKEETGIIIKTNNLKPFAVIKYYCKNYRNKSINRENQIYYFLINTDVEPDLLNTNYDDFEKDGNYKVVKIPLSKVKNILIENINLNPINKIIVEEMLKILEIYSNI